MNLPLLGFARFVLRHLVEGRFTGNDTAGIAENKSLR